MNFDPTLATLDQWLAHLEQLHPSAIDLGLERVTAVAERLDCLRPAPLVIIVGGTNGKGTTTALLAALLQAQGLKVGLYSSPHIHRYNERVVINGVEATDAQICHSLQQVEAKRDDISLTYFEFGTLAALQWFKDEHVDAAVLEIGLGGRLDAVNIAQADICAVTSIGLDHQAWLGDSVEQIAFEKCSIARMNHYLVCGQVNPPHTALETVNALGAHWCCRDEQFFIDEQPTCLDVRFQYHGREQVWALPKAHIPVPNVATAIQTLALLDRLPSQEIVVKVVEGLRVRGRLQSFQRGGLTVTLDVAHNEQAASYIGAKLKQVDGIILGMLADKEPEKVLPVLPAAQQLFLVGLDCPRGLNAQGLAARVQASVTPSLFPHVAEAIAALPESGHWLICGSFYTVEGALQVLEQEGGWTPV